ncbi:MAG TPA: hypothetical protein VJ953_18575 [Saprospiraceae bacterium]|nr:hypothetical protein [Saprospiraceae bacterium]
MAHELSIQKHAYGQTFLLNGQAISQSALLEELLRRIQELEQRELPKSFAAYEIVAAPEQALPEQLPAVNFILIDMVQMQRDWELSNYTPRGLVEGSIIRLRKADDSPGRICYSDGRHHYQYAGKKGTFLTLIYHDNHFSII